MKIVRKDVCHVWAHKLQATARWQNISFAGDSIYSYAATIARHLTAKDGTPVILFTLQGYSVTTACHKGQIRQSIPSSIPVFEVYDPREVPSKADIESYAARIANQSLVVTRAKSRMQYELDELQRLVSEANEFCEAFGFKTRFEMPANLDEMKRLAADHQAEKDKRDKAASAKRRREEKKRQVELSQRLEEWKAGGAVHPPYRPDGFDSMRIVGDDIETTSHAVIPVKHVKRAANKIVQMVRCGTEWHRNGETIRVGEYQLDSVSADGIVRVGCHQFAKAEIERIAELLSVN